jgi:crotonobetainyl-CoA:carnitine CoA-transferase CaiB-like acyl-CoA transferase
MDVLADLRVIELATGIAGPYTGKLFVDAGAEVIKVEPAGGDPARRLTAAGAALDGRDSAVFQYLNAGKRSLVGSSDDPFVHDLCAGADLLIENAEGGIDVAALRARHPHLVVLSVSPYGLQGPYAGRVSTEFTVQAESGSTRSRGTPAKPPVQVGGRVFEYLAGAYGASGALAAVLRARRTGVGEHVDLAVAEVCAIAGSTFSDLMHHLQGRPELTTPARNVETPSIERAKDGYVGFNTNTGQMFQNFLIMIERFDLLDDTELAGLAGRLRRPDWPGIMSAWMTEHTVDEIVAKASELRIPVAPVYDGATILGCDHLIARGAFVDNPGGFRQPRPPYMIDGELPPPPRPAPALDEARGQVAPRPVPVPVDPGADPSALPLAGLRVLDCTSWWAGPSSTHLLALLGAEVVHVESTSHPDGMRMTGFMFGREKWWEWGHMFAAANTDKSDITIDNGRPEGREVTKKLIAWADVMVENFAARVMEQWGFDHEAVLAINPGIVYNRMPAFGLSGPWRERVGFAQTMEQMTMASITGHAGDPPLIPRGPCDPNAGMHSAFATLVALAKRARDGRGVFVESTMIEAAMNICPQPVLEYTAYGEVLHRMGNRSPYAAPQGVYPGVGFDEWLALSIATDAQWAAFVDVLGAPPWAADPALATHAGRVAQHDALDERVAEWMRDRDVGATADALCAAGVPAARCHDARVQSRHPQMVHRHFYDTVVHPELGAHPVPTTPFRYGSVAHWAHRPTPMLGEHNADVLTRCAGLSAGEVAALEAAGIIGTRPKGS